MRKLLRDFVQGTAAAAAAIGTLMLALKATDVLTTWLGVRYETWMFLAVLVFGLGLFNTVFQGLMRIGR